jgi:hypothetical protein
MKRELQAAPLPQPQSELEIAIMANVTLTLLAFTSPLINDEILSKLQEAFYSAACLYDHFDKHRELLNDKDFVDFKKVLNEVKYCFKEGKILCFPDFVTARVWNALSHFYWLTIRIHADLKLKMLFEKNYTDGKFAWATKIGERIFVDIVLQDFFSRDPYCVT